MSHKPPRVINGVPVERSGDVLEVRGETWVTLVPIGARGRDAYYDERIWEFSLTSGRLIMTGGES